MGYIFHFHFIVNQLKLFLETSKKIANPVSWFYHPWHWLRILLFVFSTPSNRRHCMIIFSTSTHSVLFGRYHRWCKASLFWERWIWKFVVIMRVSQCCCGCSLRTGTLILLWLDLVSTFSTQHPCSFVISAGREVAITVSSAFISTI